MFGITFRFHRLLKQTGVHKEFSAGQVANTNRFSRYIYVAGNPAEEPLMEHFYAALEPSLHKEFFTGRTRKETA